MEKTINYKMEDFVPREEFIKRTGIFVTHEYFEYIQNKWVNESERMGISVDDFVDNYEKNHIGQIAETELNGTFKYLIMDDNLTWNCECIDDEEDIFDPSIWDIVDSLACGQSYERKSKQKALKNAMKAMEDVYEDAEQIYKQAVNIANTYKSLIDGNEEDVADFPKRDAFRRWR